MLRSKGKGSVADREQNLQNQAALNRVPDVVLRWRICGVAAVFMYVSELCSHGQPKSLE
jgi:hypothetical protein